MKKTSKEYKVTYKTYFNERLKKSSFHGRPMHPLYVQITFDRTPIVFKSYYFELFSQPKYGIRVAGKDSTPYITEIIRKEEALIKFVIEKNGEDFTLEVFKKEYNYYGRDLLDLMEADFLYYLFNFLHDEGLPSLAATIKKGAVGCKVFDIVQDMKSAFNDKSHKKLIDNSFYYAPPYLPLYAFAEKFRRTRLTCFTVMQWENPLTKEEFSLFFKKHYPGQLLQEVLREIQNRVEKN